MSWTEQGNYFQARYNRIYQERKNQHPEMDTFAYWEKQFCTQTLIKLKTLSGKLLDCGCGTGELDVLLARAHPQLEIEALDISSLALATARTHWLQELESVQTRLHWHHGLVEQLPFQKATFDYCLLSHMLENTKNPAVLLQRVKAVLKPEGKVIAVVACGTGAQEGCWQLSAKEWIGVMSLYGQVDKTWISPDNKQLVLEASVQQPPRVVGMIRLQGEATYLTRTLASAERLVDDFVVLEPDKSEQTAASCQKHPKVRKRIQWSQTASDVQATNQLLAAALELKPDWIFWLEPDEVLEAGGIEFLKHEMEACAPTVSGFVFDKAYFWQDEQHYRIDSVFGEDIRHARLFRIRGERTELLAFQAPALNPELAKSPRLEGLRGSLDFSPVRIKYFGYLLPENQYLVSEGGPSSGVELIICQDRGQMLRQASADLPMYYSYLRSDVLAKVPTSAKKILELGCASGRLGRALKERQRCYLAGVELNPLAAQEAWKYFDDVVVGDLNTLELPFKQGFFDCIVCADVLEHLLDPWQILKKMHQLLVPGGKLVCSLPNIRNLQVLNNLIHGQWEYQSAGILDRTHLRFFTQKQARLALADAGFEIESVEFMQDPSLSQMNYPDNRDSMVLSLDRWSIKDVTPEEFRELTAVQMLCVGKKTVALVEVKPMEQSNNRTTKVSIIIPVFNKVEYTQPCLEAIAQNTPEELYNAVIVDNASTDQTPELLRCLEGDVKVIRNEKNLGFVEACNQGAKAATGQYLLFLNNDTLPLEGWLEQMLMLLESDSTIGCVGAKLVYPDGRMQEAGGIIYSDASGWNFGKFDDPKNERYNQVCEVDYCSGACLLIRRDVFERWGGFDLRFAPAYYEDVDLCFGVRHLGYKVMYCPGAVVVHCEGVTAGTDLQSGWKQNQVVNREKFAQKWAETLRQQPPSPKSAADVPHTADRNKRQYLLSNDACVIPHADHPIHILVIDHFLPMYDKSAGSLRMFTLLRIWRQAGHQVTFIAVNGQNQERYVAELEAMGVKVYATDPEKLAKLEYEVEATPIDLPALLKENEFQLAWLSFYDVAELYLSEIRRHSPKTQIAVDTVDIHFVREQRQADLQKDRELQRKAKKTREKELAAYAQADLLIVVTPEDEKVLLRELPTCRTAIVPCIHEVKTGGKELAERKGILFVGNFNHPPNKDAAEYLCDEIVPRLKAKIPDVRVTIVGCNPPTRLFLRADQSLEVTGYVPEVDPYLRTHRVAVAPLRFGAGMKGKIGEALAHGLPVVTTSIGAEGMGLVSGEHVLIADDPEAFAQAVIRLYQDQALWEHISKAGQQLVETNFSSRAVSKKVQKIINQVLKAIESQAADVHSGAPQINNKPTVSIIVLTYNQRAYTQKCIESVMTHTQEPFELILVDNKSKDDTLLYLEQSRQAWLQHDPGFCRDFRIIANEENLGFAGGNNRGIAVAEGKYLLLLNNDVVVTPGWLERMLACAQKNPKIGIVGPMSNCVSGPQRVLPVSYDTEGLQGLTAFAKDRAKKYPGEGRRFWRVVGFCMLIKREVIDKIGGLDARFGRGNFEDDDFSLRAAIAGYESWFALDSFVHHFGSRTFAGEKIDYAQSLHQNWDIFKRKWGIPVELGYGSPVDLEPIMHSGLKPEHYCALG